MVGRIQVSDPVFGQGDRTGKSCRLKKGFSGVKTGRVEAMVAARDNLGQDD